MKFYIYLREKFLKCLDRYGTPAAIFFWVPIVLFIMVISFCSSTRAATIPGRHESCIPFALVSAEMIPYRDHGQTWEESEPILRKAVNDAMGKDGTFIRDAGDAEYAMAMFRSVWANKDPQNMVAMKVYEACMKGEARIQ